MGIASLAGKAMGAMKGAGNMISGIKNMPQSMAMGAFGLGSPQQSSFPGGGMAGGPGGMMSNFKSAFDTYNSFKQMFGGGGNGGGGMGMAQDGGQMGGTGANPMDMMQPNNMVSQLMGRKGNNIMALIGALQELSKKSPTKKKRSLLAGLASGGERGSLNDATPLLNQMDPHYVEYGQSKGMRQSDRDYRKKMFNEFDKFRYLGQVV